MPPEKLIPWTELFDPRNHAQEEDDVRCDETGNLRRYLRLADMLLKSEGKQRRAG